MKKQHQSQYIIIMGFITLVILLFSYPYLKEQQIHNCIDKTHLMCDSKCECDGLGCNY